MNKADFVIEIFPLRKSKNFTLQYMISKINNQKNIEIIHVPLNINRWFSFYQKQIRQDISVSPDNLVNLSWFPSTTKVIWFVNHFPASISITIRKH